MTAAGARRCAIYTRKSSKEGLEQSFNSLHSQREAREAYRSGAQKFTPVDARPLGVSGAGHPEGAF